MAAARQLFKNKSDEFEIEDFWLIVNYQHCDPGNEFEIISQAQIHGNSWTTLDAGCEITIKFGNAKAQGEIVMISDDLLYLQNNYASITEAYENRNKNDAITPTRVVSAPQAYEFHTIQKQIIKVSDKSTQTNALDVDYINLKKDNQSLKIKNDELIKIFENMNVTFIKASNDIKSLNESFEVKNNSSTTQEVNNNSLTTQEVDESLDPSILSPKPIKSDTISNKSNKPRKEMRKSKNSPDMFENISKDEVMTYIGVNKTAVPKKVYDKIKWENAGYTKATRKLLMALFSREVLATHSLTGKPSHFYHGSQRKMRLNQTTIHDVVSTVSKKCKVAETLVRAAITTKCADENKMYKKRVQENYEKSDDKENDNDHVPLKKFKFM